MLTQDPDQVIAPSAMTEEQLVVAIENRISGRCGLRIQYCAPNGELLCARSILLRSGDGSRQQVAANGLFRHRARCGARRGQSWPRLR
jgi:hypothetical protein